MITDLISDFGIASILNHNINYNQVTKFMLWYNMEAIQKCDTKSVIKSNIRFNISIKPITKMGHKNPKQESIKTV